MIRAEIIANQSVQEDIAELLEKEVSDIQYTVIPQVYGKGIHTKKLGDTVWPEMNFILFAYIQDSQAPLVKELIEKLKIRFPKEGISLFFVRCEEI